MNQESNNKSCNPLKAPSVSSVRSEMTGQFIFFVSSVICIFFRLSQSVILPGWCPAPPISSTEVKNEQTFILQALVPLGDDNFFSDIWDVQGPTCDFLNIFRKPNSSDFSFSLSKPHHVICSRLEAELRPQNKGQNLNLQYRVIQNRRAKESFPSCLREELFSNLVSLWLWNETLILWTCNNHSDIESHDAAVMVFVKSLSTFEYLTHPLSFSELEEKHFLVKPTNKCESTKNCPQFQCKESGKFWFFVGGSILLVIILAAVVCKLIFYP